MLDASALPLKRPAPSLEALPPRVARALWRADELGAAAAPALPTGFADLDAELPGGGWPCRALTELLQPQPSVAEWRLLGHVLGQVTARRQALALVGPPKPPHPPGLSHAGVDAHCVIWLRAETPAERLWSAEQLVGAGACGAVVVWLPQARPEQIRRLQIAAQAFEGPVFVCRPATAQHETSAAPLRLEVSAGPGWQLRVRVLKRRGPLHDRTLDLRAVPGGLDAVLTPRLEQPAASGSEADMETGDAVGGLDARHGAGRRVAAY